MSRTKKRAPGNNKSPFTPKTRKNARAKAERLEQREADKIIQRMRLRMSLMQSSDLKVIDLVHPGLDISKLRVSDDAMHACATEEIQTVLCLGFLGYDQDIKVGNHDLQPEHFPLLEHDDSFFLALARPLLVKLGIENECAVYGYEVQFRYGQATFDNSAEPGARVLIKAKEAFAEWAKQNGSIELRWAKIMTARLVKKDGSRFDPSHQTALEWVLQNNKTAQSSGEADSAGSSSRARPPQKKAKQRQARLRDEMVDEITDAVKQIYIRPNQSVAGTVSPPRLPTYEEAIAGDAARRESKVMDAGVCDMTMDSPS